MEDWFQRQSRLPPTSLFHPETSYGTLSDISDLNNVVELPRRLFVLSPSFEPLVVQSFRLHHLHSTPAWF